MFYSTYSSFSPTCSFFFLLREANQKPLSKFQK